MWREKRTEMRDFLFVWHGYNKKEMFMGALRGL